MPRRWTLVGIALFGSIVALLAGPVCAQGSAPVPSAWSTFCGGSGTDIGKLIALDATGAAIIAGTTTSSDFPTTAGSFQGTFHGGSSYGDVFVMRIPAAGGPPTWCTLIGGADDDVVRGLAVEASGAVVLVGWTSSADYPTTPGAWTSSAGGGGDVFVTRLSPAGDALLYSAVFGGSAWDEATAVAIDASGAAVVGGTTSSLDFPVTTGAFQSSFAGGVTDAFVLRLPLFGSAPTCASYLGGANGYGDVITALVLDAGGAAIVAGETASVDFPVTAQAFDPSFNGAAATVGDVFLARVDLANGTPMYATFLGGSAGEGASALLLTAQGDVVLAGRTTSTDFPTTPNADDPSYNGQDDVFVTRIDVLGGPPSYSSYLGAAGNEGAWALATDGGGATVVVGWTNSPGFPTSPGAADPVLDGSADAFVTRLPLSGIAPFYSSFLGGTGTDVANAACVLPGGGVILAGRSDSTDFPVTSTAWQPGYAGGSRDAFITRLDLEPLGVYAYGSATPGCSGPVAIATAAAPLVGTPTFAIICAQAPPSSIGILAVSDGALGNPPLAPPLPVQGATIWVDPFSSALATFYPTTAAMGEFSLPLPIPANPALAGLQVFAQFAGLDPCAPQGLSASGALSITVQ